MTVPAQNVSSSSTSQSFADSFYVIARERGKVRSDLPVWASKVEDPFQLSSASPSNDDADETCQALAHTQVERREVEGVPGVFQLLNVLSAEESKRIGR